MFARLPRCGVSPGNHLGAIWPQLMALLTQSVRSCMPLAVRLQGLQGWQEFVEGLAAEAPLQLIAVVDQVAVSVCLFLN